MSKSKGNVVAPDEVVAKYGADTVRGYLMFAFEWEKGGPWNSRDIQGVVRWLNDVWNLVTGDRPTVSGEASETDIRALRRKVHQTIEKVSEGLESFGFNTAGCGGVGIEKGLGGDRQTPVGNGSAVRES